MQGMAYSKSAGPSPLHRDPGQRDPLKEAARCRRNALLSQVKKPSRLLLKEGILLGEELGGLTPNLRV